MSLPPTRSSRSFGGSPTRWWRSRARTCARSPGASSRRSPPATGRSPATRCAPPMSRPWRRVPMPSDAMGETPRRGPMKIAKVNGVELEYEVVGSGEPVLLISPVLADGFLPLMSQPALADHHQLIRYHQRGWVGSTHTAPPVSIEDHAADAAALLAHLGVR